MRVILWAAAVIVLGLAASACGGGDGESDEEAIENLFKDAASALNDGDAGKLAGMAASECGDMEEAIAQDLEGSMVQSGDFEFKVTGVDIRNLEDESAEALILGTVEFDGQEERLEENGEYVRVVKEGGDWKIADCIFFGSEAAGSP